MSRSLAIIYSPGYQEACFQAFYAAGRPSKATDIRSILPEENGTKPSTETIRKWRDALNWDIRADELDLKVAEQSDDLLVAQKVAMLQRQATVAQEIQELGYQHLIRKGFDTAASAVSAIIKGAELERTSRGIGAMIDKLAKMSDADVVKTIKELASRMEDSVAGEIIDAGGTENNASTENEGG